MDLVALGHDTPGLTYVDTLELRADIKAHLLHPLGVELSF